MKDFVKKLIEMDACEEAVEFAKGFDSLEEAWNACPRGDWMLKLSEKSDCDLRTLMRAKAHCAATLKHLMKDQGILDELQAAFDFADGKMGYELNLADYATVIHVAHAAALENRKKTADICRKYLPIPKL